MPWTALHQLPQPILRLRQEESHGTVATIGLDIAKSTFQVHGVDATGDVVLRRRLTRTRVLPFFEKLAPCLVGMEACASSHHWARELRKLGHDVRLMPPSYVKPYVKRQKNDTADAEAICEAVTRPTMRFVEVKTPQQQSVMVLHGTRSMLMRQRIQLSNVIRGHMAEFGVVAPIGREGLLALIDTLHEETDDRVPAEARHCLQMLAAQLRLVNAQILENDRRIRLSARATDVGRRLMGIPGVGPVLASAFVATVLGLVPRQNSSGGKETAWWDHQAGKPLSAPTVVRRRHGRHPIRRAARHPPTLARAVVGTPHDKGRGGGARQQDRTDGLGHHDQRTAIQGTGIARCLTVQAREANKIGKGGKM